MKQLLPLFLFLLPCLVLAQYPSNGNQKITLGEQTTADGLIWRGVAATDTVRKPSIDTMTYMVLDTTTNIMWHYKKATSNAWLRLNLLPSDTASMLTNYWRSGRFSGTLPVANGGTNRTTMPAGYILHGDGTSIDTAIGLFWNRADIRLGVNINNPASTIETIGEIRINGVASGAGLGVFRVKGSKSDAEGFRFEFDNSNNTTKLVNFYNGPMIFGNSNSEDMRITGTGNLGIGTPTPQSGYRLHVVDSVYVGGNVSASAYTTRSDYNLKDDIFDLKYGLNEILNLQPVEYTYKSNGSKQLGFIAQDIGTILPEVVSFEESMSVNYQAIIPILTKAIQEQQALIKALEQRIINLENK
jgi:hypothetical protein